MTAFNYTALDKKQKRQKGIVEADSPRQARQQLRDRGLVPINIEAIAEKTKTKRHFAFRRRWSATDLALVTRQMATLLNSGIPIDEMLTAVSEQAEKTQVKQVILGLRAKILEGYPLAEGMKEFPSTFSKLYRTTIEAGEQSGKLGIVLEKLAEFIERQHHIRQKVRQALVYPTLMMVVSIGIVIFLLTNVVPKVIQVFINMKQTLPLSTRILIGMSHVIRTNGIWIALALIAMIYGFKLGMRRTGFRRKVHVLLLKLPVIGKAIRTVNCARFGRTLGILIASSVPVLDAMTASGQLLVPLPMAEAMQTAIEQVREGTRVNQALKNTGYFPPLFLHLVASGEASSQLEAMLEKAASYLESDIEHLIETGLSLFEPVMILVMGGVVLFIVLAIMLPIFSLDQLGANLS